MTEARKCHHLCPHEWFFAGWIGSGSVDAGKKEEAHTVRMPDRKMLRIPLRATQSNQGRTTQKKRETH